MADWSKLELPPIDLGTDKISKIASTLSKYLETLAAIIKTIAKLDTSVSSAVNITLQAILDELNHLITGLLDQSGGYVLYVPLSKKLMTDFYGLGDITPGWMGHLGIFSPTTSDVRWDDPTLNSFIVNANRYSGGNAGFFRTVLNSLYDDGDLNRPQFIRDDDYIGGLVLLLGTSNDPLGFLDDIWRFNGLFRMPDPLPRLPRPMNLTAQVVECIEEDTHLKMDVFLGWETLTSTDIILKELEGVSFYPDRYAIIRCKNNTSSLNATSVVELLETQNLTTGSTSIDGSCEVILEDDYNITITNYLDQNVIAAPSDTYYYTLAWKLKGVSQDKTEKDLPYWHISNVARVTPHMVTTTSIYPDWIRTPSVSSLFPSVAFTIKQLTSYITGLSSRITNTTDILDSYVMTLESEVDKYKNMANVLLSQLAKIQTLFVLPRGGIYLHYFNDYGGNNFFISDLASALMPDSKNTNPPFHRGDEYVTGAVLLSGGPIASVTLFINALKLFFRGKTVESSRINMLANDLEQHITELESDFSKPKISSDNPTSHKVTRFNAKMEAIN
jgi:hypothetical protein